MRVHARSVLQSPALTEGGRRSLAIGRAPTQYVQSWCMPDGTRVMVRPIRPDDEPLMRDFYATLSEQTVYLRYLHMVQRSQPVAHEALSHLCFVDFDQVIALVVEGRDSANEGPVNSGCWAAEPHGQIRRGGVRPSRPRRLPAARPWHGIVAPAYRGRSRRRTAADYGDHAMWQPRHAAHVPEAWVPAEVRTGGSGHGREPGIVTRHATGGLRDPRGECLHRMSSVLAPLPRMSTEQRTEQGGWRPDMLRTRR